MVSLLSSQGERVDMYYVKNHNHALQLHEFMSPVFTYRPGSRLTTVADQRGRHGHFTEIGLTDVVTLLLVITAMIE